MLSPNQTGNVSSYRVDASYASTILSGISSWQERQQDTVKLPGADTLRLIVTPEIVYEGLSDSLTESTADSLYNHPDTLVVSVSDSASVEIADTVSQIINVQEAAIVREGQVTVRTASVPEQTEKVQRTYIFDPSFYLEQDTSRLFIRENPFISQVAAFNIQESQKPLFPDGVSLNGNNSSKAYREYLQTDINEVATGKIHYSGVWIPALVILSLLLITWIKLIYVQFLTPVLVSAFNYKQANKLYQEKNVPAQNAFLILHAIFVINGGLFILFLAGYFNLRLPEIRPVLIFLIASATIFLLVGLKFVAISIIGILFDKQRLFSEYNHNVSLYNKIYGILLLPVIAGLLYAGEKLFAPLIYTGIVLALVFYLLQLLRGLEIIFRKGFSLFYLILYLCAFEIFPIVVLYKIYEMLMI